MITKKLFGGGTVVLTKSTFKGVYKMPVWVVLLALCGVVFLADELITWCEPIYKGKNLF